VHVYVICVLECVDCS